ncbi:MAG: hypothetical protein Q9217_006471 [Psora testacea]
MPLPLHLPTWSATKTTSKAGFDKIYNLVDKLGPPVNRLSNKLGSEAFWPTTLDRESDKTARILRSFCKDGFYVEEEGDGWVGEDGKPKGKQRVVKKIPTEVIKKAKGLAIFTTMRTGLWVSGAGGSGILVARKADGSWSPPSGIMLHTAGLGFLVGVDIYDCVVVINTEKALEAFTKIRCTLGGEVSAVAGPVGVGGVLETEVHKRQAPVWNYLKSRGFYAGVQIDGTVIIERTDENERFYGERIGVADILAGKVRHPPFEVKTLMATIKAAQGDTDVDESILPASEPTPGDYEVKDDGTNGFGLPPPEDDPDPFGVRALEQEGMLVREAGTGSRPSIEAFEYKPSATSPIFSTFHARRNSKRDSGKISIASTHTDRGTQTADFDSPRMIDSPSLIGTHSPIKKTSENLAEEVEDGNSNNDQEERHDQPTEATVISRAKLITIPRRIPPALPPRNPYRARPVVNAATPASPTVTEHQELGLGIGMDMSREEGANMYPASSQDALDEKLEQIHLAPAHDPERLSPNKDGFDEVSMSGSDYSRGTPAYTPANEPNESTITMRDTEAECRKDEKAKKANEEEETKEDHETYPTYNGQEFEDFHSIPGTPLEATVTKPQQIAGGVTAVTLKKQEEANNFS